MKENNVEKNEEVDNNKFLNENLKVLEDKEKEFEVNLGTSDKNYEDEEYNYDAFEKKEESIKHDESENKFNSDYVDVKEKGFDFSIIFLILAIVSIGGLFGNELLRTIGLVISLISLFGSMITLKKRHKFSEVAFSFSIILVIIYIIVYVITLTKVDKTVDGEKAKLFKEKAMEVIESTRKDVIDNTLLRCNARGISEKKIVTSSLEETSPFGYRYNKETSYVLVEAHEENGECIYQYSIYLTDDNYSLGTIVEPVLEERVLNSNMRRVKVD